MPTPETALAVLAGVYAVDLGWRIIAPRIMARRKEADIRRMREAKAARLAARPAGLGPPAPTDLAELINLWPGAGCENLSDIFTHWAGLTNDEKDKACAAAPAVINCAREAGRRHLFSLSAYLTGRHWRELEPEGAIR